MRRLALFVLAASLILQGSGCRRIKRAISGEPENGPFAMVNLADPKAEPQLVRGFHQVEQQAWRWTEGSFTVNIRPPKNSKQNGATLVMAFSIPESLMAKSGAPAITATVNGTGLPPETVAKPGDQTYRRDVPASALTGDLIKVDFTLDHYAKAGDLEQRELGLIVKSIGLEAK